MADITDQKVPYEIMVRFGDDHAPRGAHVIWRRVVIVNGEVLKDEILPAQPLDLADFPTSEIMTDATKVAIAASLTARVEIANISGRLTTKKNELSESEHLVGLLNGELALVKSQASDAIGALTRERDELGVAYDEASEASRKIIKQHIDEKTADKARIEELSAQLAELQNQSASI